MKEHSILCLLLAVTSAAALTNLKLGNLGNVMPSYNNKCVIYEYIYIYKLKFIIALLCYYK